ncbi:MAG: hypothetical protein ACTSVI_00090 [Promethearchaeota archaeon]
MQKCYCDCELKDKCSISEYVFLGAECPLFHRKNIKCLDDSFQGLDDFERIDLNPNPYL